MDSPAPSIPKPTPCTCRICGQVMATAFQSGTIRVPGQRLLTCANPVCWMQNYTFSERSYPSIDLALYRAAV